MLLYAGFDSSSIMLFRDQTTGNPRVPRNPAFSFVVANAYYVETSCGTIPVPPSNLVSISRGLGRPCTTIASDAPLNCVARVTLPRSVEAARRHFACDTLDGPELENNASGCATFGSHWEQRLFRDERMSPQASEQNDYLSIVTLALLEDSGWYIPDYSMADTESLGRRFGAQMGCQFANTTCLVPGVTQPTERTQVTGVTPQYCAFNSSQKPFSWGQMRCSADRTGFGTCYVTTKNRSAWEQYYTASPSFGGGGAFMDGCPAIFNDYLCSDPTVADILWPRANYFGMVLGPSSMCTQSTLLNSSYWGSTSAALCVDVVCASDGLSLVMSIASSTRNGTRNVTCVDGSTLATFSGYSGSVTCLDPKVVCPTPARLSMCASRTTCSACVADASCGWCGGTSTCLYGSSTPTFETCSTAWSATLGACPNPNKFGDGVACAAPGDCASGVCKTTCCKTTAGASDSIATCNANGDATACAAAAYLSGLACRPCDSSCRSCNSSDCVTTVTAAYASQQLSAGAISGIAIAAAAAIASLTAWCIVRYRRHQRRAISSAATVVVVGAYSNETAALSDGHGGDALEVVV